MPTEYVLGFAFNETESALALLLKARPEWQRGHLNGIGGHIEKDETPIAAMNREWEEETEAEEVQWRLFATLTDGADFEIYCFRGNLDLSGIYSQSLGEVVIVVDPDDLPVNIVPNLSWLVPMARMRNSRDWPFKIQEKS